MLILIACRKNQEYKVELPEISSTGRNTMAFLYNGSTVWSSIEHGIFIMSDQPDNIPNASAIIYSEPSGNHTLQLYGSMRIKNKDAVTINNSSFIIDIEDYDFGTHTYSLDTNPGFVHYKDNISSKFYSNDTLNAFTIQIQYIDTTQKIISGTFQALCIIKTETQLI